MRDQKLTQIKSRSNQTVRIYVRIGVKKSKGRKWRVIRTTGIEMSSTKIGLKSWKNS